MSSKRERSSAKIRVLDQDIAVYSQTEEDYISLTDIARYKNQDRTDDIIRNWLCNRNTLEFLGIWERLNNPHFNPVEFDGINVRLKFILPMVEEIEAELGGELG
jgi:hypothetical protein